MRASKTTAKVLARWLVRAAAPHWPGKRSARSMARRTGFGWKAVRKQLKRLRKDHRGFASETALVVNASHWRVLMGSN